MLLEEAERILHLTEQVKQRILFRQAHVGGKVNIGLAPTLAEWIASDLLEQVRTDFPEITLNFMEGLSPRLRKMLVTGVVDVAVLSLNVDPAHLILGASFTEPISLIGAKGDPLLDGDEPLTRSEEHTSELQSLMRISYAVFCLK